MTGYCLEIGLVSLPETDAASRRAGVLFAGRTLAEESHHHNPQLNRYGIRSMMPTCNPTDVKPPFAHGSGTKLDVE